MKFQPDIADGANVITRQEPGRIWVGNQPYAHSLLVPRAGEVLRWEVAELADLTSAHFERIAALRPELVIFGSGARLRFVAPALLRSLIEERIGVETMDTPAACRTYNVLASEGRLVLAALLVETVPPA
ncbi:MAG: Mth938-like domain-containing protein [Burkholderiales bacterium]|nr:Mth938-like domain-containing protein [Burkholderiales bacterium]